MAHRLMIVTCRNLFSDFGLKLRLGYLRDWVSCMYNCFFLVDSSLGKLYTLKWSSLALVSFIQFDYRKTDLRLAWLGAPIYTVISPKMYYRTRLPSLLLTFSISKLYDRTDQKNEVLISWNGDFYWSCLLKLSWIRVCILLIVSYKFLTKLIEVITKLSLF